MSNTKPRGLSVKTTSGDSSCPFQVFPSSQEVVPVAALASLFRTVKQHFGSFPPSETVELGCDCSPDSFAVKPAYCPLREQDVTVLQGLQERSIIKGIAEH